MSFPAKLAEVAFKMHEQGRIDRDRLVAMLETCVNIAAIENGYADTHGMPCPERRRQRREEENEDEDENENENEDEDDDDEDEDDDEDDDDEDEDHDDEISV